MATPDQDPEELARKIAHLEKKIEDAEKEIEDAKKELREKGKSAADILSFASEYAANVGLAEDKKLLRSLKQQRARRPAELPLTARRPAELPLTARRPAELPLAVVQWAMSRAKRNRQQHALNGNIQWAEAIGGFLEFVVKDYKAETLEKIRTTLNEIATEADDGYISFTDWMDNDMEDPTHSQLLNGLRMRLKAYWKGFNEDAAQAPAAGSGPSDVRTQQPKRVKTTPEDFNPQLFPLVVVAPPPAHSNDPKWTAADGWLDNVCADIETGIKQSMADDVRVPPMAVVRCSRGGKTRALKEIARLFKSKHPDVAVIFVTFNNDSALVTDERKPYCENDNPFAALYRRIAFAAKAETASFDLYRSVQGSTEDMRQKILDFVGDQPCLLIIDELNLMEGKDLQTLADLLKNHFLDKKNRYLLFSSHVISTTNELVHYMESVSTRPCIVKELPLIPSLKSAAENLKFPGLTPMEAIFLSKIPSLIYLKKNGGIFPAKREIAIRSCTGENGLKLGDTQRLLSSFITGDYRDVPQALLQLMTTETVGDRNRIRWILVHMVDVLDRLEIYHQEDGRKLLLRDIVNLLQHLPDKKIEDGGTWETLFTLALLIRYVCNRLNDSFLPKPHGDYTTSYNLVFHGDFSTQEPSKFLQGIDAGEPPQYPHVGVYYPTHAKFQNFDVIVGIFDSPESPTRKYAYQLKDGKSAPKKVSGETMKKIEKMFWIRGKACQKSKNSKGWHDASEDEINRFLGVTGRLWAPAKWKELLDEYKQLHSQ